MDVCIDNLQLELGQQIEFGFFDPIVAYMDFFFHFERYIIFPFTQPNSLCACMVVNLSSCVLVEAIPSSILVTVTWLVDLALQYHLIYWFRCKVG